MQTILTSIIKSLLVKHIPFCLYRYPQSDIVGLAVQENYLPHTKEASFLIVPFHQQSTAKTQMLFIVNENYLTQDYLQFINTSTSLINNEVENIPIATTKDAYLKAFNAYTTLMKEGKIHKAILSRIIHIHKPTNFNELDYFQTLKNAYPNTLVYLSYHPQFGMWMGASPELLLKKHQQQYAIAALAGTQKINDNATYTWRFKEQEEHKMVADYIADVFKRNHLSLIEKTNMETIVAGEVVHLKTSFSFKDNQQVAIENLLNDLHPTPAVGGLPKQESIDCILQYEGYDRAYYTGYLGITDFNNLADFYVNLRCMQLFKNKIIIYVGGGITAASNAEEEWIETTLKSKTLLKFFEPKEINA